jgi:hypothetical protein
MAFQNNLISTKNFDNIRIIALLSILAVHTNLPNSKLLNNTNFDVDSQFLMYIIYINVFKAGTILFFIVSGFLFEMQSSKFIDFSVFIKRKVSSLLRPYFILFFVPTIVIIGLIEPNFGVFKENMNFHTYIIRIIENVFLTNYWFVPALFITLVINYFIAKKNIIKSLIVFVPIWLFCYINTYLKFAPSGHTIWFIGFFVVFTMGRLICIYNNKIADINLFKSKKKILLIVFIFYVISNLESILIFNYGHNLDYLNTLRIGNITYSIFLFFLLNMIFNKIVFVLPFGFSFYFIYLIHPFVLRAETIFLYQTKLNIPEYPLNVFYNVMSLLLVLFVCVILHQFFFKLKINSKYISEYIFKKTAKS